MSRFRNPGQGGFTIIELMIATAVFSTILLLVTVMMINIGNLYYKGVNQARAQDSARSITDEVSQHLQLGDPWIPASDVSGQKAYCIGSTRYTYVIGAEIGSPTAAPAATYQHVLWRDDNPSPGSCSTTGVNLKIDPASSSGKELIAPNSRLINFSISGSSPYSLTVGVAYGDNDLLCSASVAGSCSSSDAMAHAVDYMNGSLTCKGNIGDQFCATSNLSTSVVRRLP